MQHLLSIQEVLGSMPQFTTFFFKIYSSFFLKNDKSHEYLLVCSQDHLFKPNHIHSHVFFCFSTQQLLTHVMAAGWPVPCIQRELLALLSHWPVLLPYPKPTNFCPPPTQQRCRRKMWGRRTLSSGCQTCSPRKAVCCLATDSTPELPTAWLVQMKDALLLNLWTEHTPWKEVIVRDQIKMQFLFLHVNDTVVCYLTLIQ